MNVHFSLSIELNLPRQELLEGEAIACCKLCEPASHHSMGMTSVNAESHQKGVSVVTDRIDLEDLV